MIKQSSVELAESQLGRWWTLPVDAHWSWADVNVLCIGAVVACRTVHRDSDAAVVFGEGAQQALARSALDAETGTR